MNKLHISRFPWKIWLYIERSPKPTKEIFCTYFKGNKTHGRILGKCEGFKAGMEGKYLSIPMSKLTRIPGLFICLFATKILHISLWITQSHAAAPGAPCKICKHTYSCLCHIGGASFTYFISVRNRKVVFNKIRVFLSWLYYSSFLFLGAYFVPSTVLSRSPMPPLSDNRAVATDLLLRTPFS